MDHQHFIKINGIAIHLDTAVDVKYAVSEFDYHLYDNAMYSMMNYAYESVKRIS